MDWGNLVAQSVPSAFGTSFTLLLGLVVSTLRAGFWGSAIHNRAQWTLQATDRDHHGRLHLLFEKAVIENRPLQARDGDFKTCTE